MDRDKKMNRAFGPLAPGRAWMSNAVWALLCACLLWPTGWAAAQGRPGLSEAEGAYRTAVQRRREFAIATHGAANVRKQAKWYPYFVLARTKSHGCGDGSLAEYMTRLLDAPDPERPGAVAPEMFAGPPFARYLHTHRDCLSQEQIGRIAAALEKPRRLFDHGTLNHASMTSTTWYLLAQEFPDLAWTDLAGRRYSSEELTRTYKDLMVRRYRKFLKDGEFEQLSPTYAMVNLFTTLNLVDFARDQELRRFAEAYLVQALTVLRVSSFRGVILPPLARQNAQQRSGPARKDHPCVSPAQHALWLYFGEPEIGRFDLESGCEPTYVAMLASSDWLPPFTLAGFPAPETLPFEHHSILPTFSIWDASTQPSMTGKLFRARHFAIGSGNGVFDPLGYNTSDQSFMLAWDRPAEFNYLECFHPYWTSNAGADAWSFSRTPSGAPNTTSRSSPFQQSYFHQGRGVLLFSIPQADPWPGSREPRFFAARDRQKDALFARQNCHFPKEVDEYGVEGSWIFIRAGQAFVGIETVGLTPTITEAPDDPTVLGFNKLTTEARHAAIFIVAEDAETAGSFSAFKRKAKSIRRHHDPARDLFSFAGEDGRSHEVAFRLEPQRGTDAFSNQPRVTIDGAPRPETTGAIISGPNYRIGGGRLHVETATGTLDISVPPSGAPQIAEKLKAR